VKREAEEDWGGKRWARGLAVDLMPVAPFPIALDRARDRGACFIVRGANEQALAFVYWWCCTSPLVWLSAAGYLLTAATRRSAARQMPTNPGAPRGGFTGAFGGPWRVGSIRGERNVTGVDDHSCGLLREDPAAVLIHRMEAHQVFNSFFEMRTTWTVSGNLI
jgi:hypothetical protein